ncbi:bifunctional phosphoribosylaminoimidazolecarboxamide formyltransferase/IMP cyclohydrolase [Aestuariivirga sp.]|uniref:bifunctional phosphoribosylaminoimidazolecarboxamide formyltransferase/IMP cyclohydrolase n=1 Tax=Aestuariivirga sp. TaxID=2650926 RepID=UPI0039E70982
MTHAMTNATLRPVARALLSVSDKTGLIDFATALSKRGIALLSTGGTAKALREAGLTVRDVSEETGFPEIMDGRVKTLHPAIHGGLLSVRGNAVHEKAQADNNIRNIDLLVVNLYPFEQTVARKAGAEETIENIDVGGPAMIRAAAKNHDGVAVVTDPADYAAVLADLEANNGATTLALRTALAAKAFARTASYDAAIAAWFQQQAGNTLPARVITAGTRELALRYGENPHQEAALYRSNDGRVGLLDAKQVQGKELSYNNINDADAALECVAEFSGTAPACVIVKHANPCGVAVGGTLAEAYAKALACDPVSAFGGIIALNHPLDAATAKAISAIFTEVILAPGASDEALQIMAAKKNLRLLLLPGMPDAKAQARIVKSIAGGLLVQTRDATALDEITPKVVSKRAPTEGELADLRFAWRVAKHVKSNAIVFAKDGATVGVGAGQMSRIDSTRIAVSKSLDAAKAMGGDTPLVQGAVLASDAFFPFADGIEAAADAGATAIIQPGGSIKDEDVIKAADARGLAMIFTGQRHFRH